MKKYFPVVAALLLGFAIGHTMGSRRAHAGFLDKMKKTVAEKVDVVHDLRTFGKSLKAMDRDIRKLRGEMETMQEAKGNIAKKLHLEDKLAEK